MSATFTRGCSNNVVVGETNKACAQAPTRPITRSQSSSKSLPKLAKAATGQYRELRPNSRGLNRLQVGTSPNTYSSIQFCIDDIVSSAPKDHVPARIAVISYEFRTEDLIFVEIYYYVGRKEIARTQRARMRQRIQLGFSNRAAIVIIFLTPTS